MRDKGREKALLGSTRYGLKVTVYLKFSLYKNENRSTSQIYSRALTNIRMVEWEPAELKAFSLCDGQVIPSQCFPPFLLPPFLPLASGAAA